MRRLLFVLLLLGMFSLNAATSTQRGLDKSAACAACHGPQGISVNPEWPNLAGQHADYLMKQLHDYKDSSKRNSSVMSAMVASLTEQDITDLAEFYASLPLPSVKQHLARPTSGETLYRFGEMNRNIPSCIACHGPRGTGSAQAGFPVISRQNEAYTVQQLQAFKNKTRSNDLNSIMREISARMSVRDMKAVAHYLADLE